MTKRATLRNTLRVLSLAPCVAVIVLWGRGDTHDDCLRLQLAGRRPTAATVAPLDLDQLDDMRRRLGWPDLYQTDALLLGTDRGDLFVARQSSFWPRDDTGVHYVDLRPMNESPSVVAAVMKGDPAVRVSAMLGLKYTTWQIAGAQAFRGLTVPLWFVVVLTVLPPAVVAVRWVRPRRRRARGQCPTCRYDLTGNVSGVCPECGSPVRPPAPATGTPGQA